ncbi:PSP1-domain-containing protein [Dacryopinax primogenitus]|uniref:PSP1-domain-containing protein n=1 Tax=Dacryopinax primogenitus (strain DJM 731) TaxID=1858805 RepID=M5FQ56_DACPD|nr:PSP1-domain-containing protein [Dacryopinax primogenitus]EJT98980.1 PSP1-domain-containing protein [Dacryopinax primogenitus]
MMQSSEDIERKPRFALDPSTRRSSAPRATSQPARNDIPISASPVQTPFETAPPNIGGSISSNGVWGSPLRAGVHEPTWVPRAIPIRSASFSVSEAHPHHDTRGRMSFPSTFEDEEEEEAGVGGGHTPDHNSTPSGTFSHSRSQSMANDALRGHALALPLPGSTGLARNWGERDFDTLGAFDFNGQSGLRRPSLSPIRRSHVSQDIDLSNMSPFVRDVSQIFNDEPAPMREPWITLGGAGNWREDNGGGSGTTSRRHSVSIVQPRRAISGFVIPGESDRTAMEDAFHERENNGFALGTFGTGALRISDEDLISGLSSLNVHKPPTVVSRGTASSQPSSLPTYPPVGAYGQSPNLTYSGEAARGSFSTSIAQPQSRSPTRGYIGRTASFSSSTKDAFGPNGFSQTSFQTRDPNLAYLVREDTIGHTMPRSQAGMPVRSFPTNQHESSSDVFIPSSSMDYSLSPVSAMYQPGPAASTSGLPRLQTGAMPTNIRPPLSPSTFTFSRPGHQAHYGQGSMHSHRNQTDATSPTLSDLGKGVPLYSVPESDHLYIVEFKAGRTDIFYCPDPSLNVRTGDLVIVEADRGKDLGKVVNDTITLADVEFFLKQAADPAQSTQTAPAGTQDAYLFAALSGPLSNSSSGPPLSPTVPGAPKPVKEIMPKRIYSKAQPQETQLLVSKMHDETKALQLCQNKVRQKRLPMQVVDAEFQWDRRKLTFYFTADKRIDFRELVRELFRLYKTRIWMACLGENVGEYSS